MFDEYKKNVAASFNKAVVSYDQSADLQYAVGVALVLQLFELQRKFHRVADIGAGTGALTRQLSLLSMNADYFLIDIAYDLLSSYTPEEGLSTFSCCADFDNLPLVSQSFDLVFANMSLQWSLNFGRTIKELLRCLKSGGVLALALPVTGTLTELSKTHRINCFLSPDQVDDIITEFNVSILFSHQEVFQKECANQLELLKFLKNTGSNCYLSYQPELEQKMSLRRSKVTDNFNIYFLVIEKL